MKRGTTAGSKDEKGSREAGKEYEALSLHKVGLVLCYRIVAVHEAAARPQRSDSINQRLNHGMDTNAATRHPSMPSLPRHIYNRS